MKLHVSVTQELINEANHSACCSCPIALSFRSPVSQITYPKVGLASVHKQEAYLVCANEDRTSYTAKVDLPVVVQDFITQWDARQEVKPFEFDCEANLYCKGSTRLVFPTLAEKEALAAA